MNIWESFLLGIIQGLTEFLPVSSSGHLELGKAFLGDQSLPEESLLFTVVVRAATALSTIVIFRKEVLQILVGLTKFSWNEETQFSVKIVISMVPAALIGILFNDQIEALFSRQILLVGAMLIITGLLLFLADKATKTDKTVGYDHALTIGVSQMIAILPGISRSGATISTSVLLGIDREKAARFSFLMVVPLILGKMAKDILSGDISVQSESFLPLAAGFFAAFLAGLLACQWMISLVKNSQLKYFSYYCFTVGFLSILGTLLF
jgi:undecaprenyl-diphosphatase